MNSLVFFLLLIVVIFLLYLIVEPIIVNIFSKMEDETTKTITKRENTEIEIKEEPKGESVPKQILQTYKSIDKVPSFVIDNIKKDNPDWDYIFFDDKDVEEFLKKEYHPQILDKFLSFKRGAHKADLFRLCWLYKNGGVYVDIDTHLLKPIDEIIMGKDLIIPLTIVNGKRRRLLNCFMVAKKGDPFILKCIKSIMKITQKELSMHYCMILRVMQETLEGEYEYEFYEKPTSDLFGKKTWHIYDKMDNVIADSRYENYDSVSGFI